jgi:hypothetical protein
VPEAIAAQESETGSAAVHQTAAYGTPSHTGAPHQPTSGYASPGARAVGQSAYGIRNVG